MKKISAFLIAAALYAGFATFGSTVAYNALESREAVLEEAINKQ